MVSESESVLSKGDQAEIFRCLMKPERDSLTSSTAVGTCRIGSATRVEGEVGDVHCPKRGAETSLESCG